MFQLPIAILSHTPLWVWGLFAGLVVLGLNQARTQVLTPRRLLALPLAIGAWSLWSAAGAFAPVGAATVVAAWLAGAAIGHASNRGLDLPRRCEALDDGRFRIGGSLAPLALMMGVFVVRYANGVAVAMHPRLAATPAYVIVASLAFGLPAGLLVARARKVLATGRHLSLARA